MTDQHTADSSPVSDSTPRLSKRTRRARAMRSAQDAVPYHATERRDPHRVLKALEHARLCAQIADDNRDRDIVVLDLRKSTALVDFFLIVTAVSRRQSRATASEIDQAMKQRGEQKLGLEGSEDGRWTLIDYGDFVVHIFSPEGRAYYGLEEIWGDASQVDWQETPRG